MANPIKIYEIKGEDFAKGFSYFSDYPFGGNMAEITNFDPFLDYGYFTPSFGSLITDQTKTSTPKFLTTFNDSGTAKLYVHTDDKLYSVLDGTPYTNTDVSSEINVTNPVGGVAVFKNKYIYAHPASSKVFANSIPVASASNVEILSSATSSEYYRAMCVAPDKNLYIADFSQIAQITNVAGTSGNTAGYYLLESTFEVRDLTSDGNYLIAIADNNASHKISAEGNVGSNRCQVLFYDVNNGRSTPDYIYEFTDSYVTSVKVLDGAVYIFGKDNLWVCNSQTKPKAIFNFQTGSTITEPPRWFFQVHQRNNVIYWCGLTNQKIYAYGSKVAGAKKIFFQPYNTGDNPTCLITSGNNVYVGSNGGNAMLAVLNSAQTKQDATFSTGYFPLEQPYKFAYVKVVMKAKLATGGDISVGMNSLAGEITNYTTKTFSTVGAKQSIIFEKASDSGNPPVANFNEFNLTVVSNQGVSKVEVWATPENNYDQTV